LDAALGRNGCATGRDFERRRPVRQPGAMGVYDPVVDRGVVDCTQIGAARDGQILSAVFGVTLPMGVLQATSTQTDYATAIWVIGLAYFAVLAHQRALCWMEWLAVSAVTGLGVLTKGSFYPFAAPFLVWILVSTLRRANWRRALQALGLGVVLVLSLNAGIWGRNLHAYGFPFGPPQDVASLSNEKYSLGVWIGNLMRNSTLHLGTPYGVINGPVRQFVEAGMHWMGEDANDPLTTLGDSPYRVRRSNQEDYAGNPWQFLFMPASLLILATAGGIAMRGKRILLALRQPEWLLALALLAGFLLFALLYKWQATGSRLQLPFFVTWMPLAGLALERLRWQWVRYGLACLFLAGGVTTLVANPSRSLLPSEQAGLFNLSRQEVLFANSPEYRQGYLSLLDAAQATGCDFIGLMIDSHDPEYPFWVSLAPSGQETRLEHVQADSTLRPCAVICTYCSEPTLLGLPHLSSHFGGYSLYANP